MSVALYIAFLAAVGAGRLVELAISRRNQRRLRARGVVKIREPHFVWMVMLHSGVLVAAGSEVVLLHRPVIRYLAASMVLVFLLANALRWWVIRTMSEHWNVQVMASSSLGVVSHGPFRWVRHPNYVAVTLELVSLPLIHSAWLTALAATIANAWILRERLSVEEGVLSSDPNYRATMQPKPRFLPRLF